MDLPNEKQKIRLNFNHLYGMIYLSNGSEVKSKTIISGMQTRSIVVKNLEFYKNSETSNRQVEDRFPESCTYKNGRTRKRADKISRTRHRVVNE